jgi:hypothetical protein
MDGYNVNSMVCGYSRNVDACQVSYMSFKIFELLKKLLLKLIFQGDSGEFLGR